MLKQVFITAAAITLAVSAQASTSRVTAEAKIRKNEKTYILQDRGSNTYTQISASQEAETRMTGTGLFARVNQKSKNNDAVVPGVTSGGYSRLSLYQDSAGNTYVNIDIEADVQSDGFSIKMPIKYSMPVVFSSGSWAAYQAGQAVELRPTEAGERIAAEMLGAKMRFALTTLRSQLENQLAASGARLGDIKIEKLAIKGASAIRGDVNRLVISGAEVELEMSFEVSL